MPSGKIKLDAVGCCALAHAFLRNPAQVNRWAQFTGPLQMLAEIFSGNTSNLEFIPNEQTVMIYRAFAKIEIQRLADHADGRLRCRHGVEAHVDALIRLLSCLPADTSN